MGIEKRHRPLLAAICASLFCMPFMLAGVNAVLPAIGESLDASARQLGLIGAFYSLGLAVFQLASGSLGDIFGRRRIFLLGIAIFAAAGAALGFVRSAPLFIALRLLQGLGGAMFNASGLALLASAARRKNGRPTSASAALPSTPASPADRPSRALWRARLAGAGSFGAMPWPLRASSC